MTIGLGVSDPFTTLVASIAFWIAAVAATVGAALMVGTIRNMVRAALALTVVLGSVAAIYVLLAADFLAVVQLAVYVGAIMVLIIFAIFMTPGQVDNPGHASPGQRLGAGLVAALVFAASVIAIFSEPWNIRAAPLDTSNVEALGGLMLTRYLLPFEIASILLTVALVGAIVVARED